jgi:tetratricopeptide (TPR) repeat protein
MAKKGKNGEDAGAPAGGAQAESGDEVVCRNCGTKFRVAEGERPRCPSCLRVHGVGGGDGPAQAEPQAPAKRGGARAWLVVVLIAALGAGAYFVWRAQRGAGGTGGAGSGASAAAAEGVDAALAAELRRQGIPADAIVAAVGKSAAMSARAKEALGGKVGPAAQAAALWSVAEGWLKARGGRAGYEELLRKQLVRVAPKAFEELSQGAPGGAFGLEVAAALVSMARAAGVAAWGFELKQGGGKPMVEAGPVLANVGVAVYSGQGREGEPAVIDVAAGAVGKREGRRLEDAELAAHFYAARAGYFFLRSEGRRANEDSERALKLDPKSPAIAATRAMVLIAFGQGEAALAQLRRAVELSGGAARYLVLNCLSLIQADQPDDAVELCKKAAEREPGTPANHCALAYAYLGIGESDKALEAAERARKLDDTVTDVHKVLAHVYSARGENDKAKASLEQAHRIDPTARGVHLIRALMAMKEMDADGAVAALEKELEVDPDNERMRALLATTLLRDGKKEAGEKVLQEMRRRSRDPVVTDQLIAKVRAEVGEDDAGDDRDDVDGGTVGAAADATGDGGVAVGGTAQGSAPATAPAAGPFGAPSSSDDKDDDKDLDKDDADDKDPAVEPGDTKLPEPGQRGTAPPRFFDLKPSGNP